MPRTCTVCHHDDREPLDAELVMGIPYRDLASRYGVSISALSRHRRDHVSPALAKVIAERETAGAESALDRLEALHGRVMRLLDAAEGDGRASLMLAAVREARSLVELVARIRGELDERPQVAVVNLQTSDQWLTLRAVLAEALAPYPDAAQAVTVGLLALEAS